MEVTDLNRTTGQAIHDFYDKHDFGEDGGINKKYAWIKFGFFDIFDTIYCRNFSYLDNSKNNLMIVKISTNISL